MESLSNVDAQACFGTAALWKQSPLKDRVVRLATTCPEGEFERLYAESGFHASDSFLVMGDLDAEQGSYSPNRSVPVRNQNGDIGSIKVCYLDLTYG